MGRLFDKSQSGYVFSGKIIETNHQVLIKLFFNKRMYQRELDALTRLQEFAERRNGIALLYPKVHFSGQVRASQPPGILNFNREPVVVNYLVTDRFGGSLDTLPTVKGNIPVLLNLGVQIIDAYEVMHSAGVLHNGLASKNVVCGLYNQSND